MKQIILLCMVFVQSVCLQSQTGWYQINPNTPNNSSIVSVSFGDMNTGYICGLYNNFNSRFIKKTTNQGETWDSVNSFNASTLHNMIFINAQTGFVTGEMAAGQYNIGTIAKTSDGGMNWYISNPSNSSEFYGIQFINDNTGFAVGFFHNATNDAKVIFKTVNAGLSWQTSVSYFNTYDRLYDVHFPSAQTGYVVGSSSLIKTINSGSTWNQLTLGIGTGYTIYFINDNTGVVGGYSGDVGTIQKTNNGGINWTTVFSSDSSVVNEIKFVNANTGFATVYKNNYGIILKTTNSGANWNVQKLTLRPVGDIFFINEVTGIACSDHSMLWKTTDGGGPIGIQQISNEIPKVFYLFQNYPNPFNPTTMFKFDLSKNSEINLTVFDIMGKEIETIVNVSFNAGSYEVDWNAAKYPSGIYFYRLKTNDHIETRKMILIK